MCGRYTITVEEEILFARFKILENGGQFTPRYNVAPTQNNPVVLLNQKSQRIMAWMKWGLIPFWAKDASIGSRMINARLETLTQKPSFKTALIKRRCLVPADGYYEWSKTGNTRNKQPFRIVLKSRELFTFAGLWDEWKNEEGDKIQSYTIITTEADSLVAKIHPRMPMILRPENEDKWIDPALKDVDTIEKLLRPYPFNIMEMYEVSPLVGSANIDVESLVESIK